MKYKVTVEKSQSVNGDIEVEANSPLEAIDVVQAMMDAEETLQTNDPRIVWDDPEYIDFSFITTGDVKVVESEPAPQPS